MEAVVEQTGFAPYPVYKNSGVEWLGDVPEHWKVKKIKRVFQEIKKRTNVELGCGSISFGKVIYKDDEKIPEATKKSYQVVLKGDFLVNPLNLNYDLISLRIALSEIDVVVSSGYIVLTNVVELDKNYFKWFLHRFDVAFMKTLGAGVRQTLNFNDIGNCDLLFPPLEEQTAIANFLDRKIELIDKAITRKQKQIELLNERRQVLIQEAVTNGLNPNVPFKDSGVEWIGEIPAHWEVKRLKHVAKTVLGKMLCNEDKGNYQLKPYLKSKNIQWLKVDVNNVDEMWFSKKELKDYKLIKDDLILSEGGEVGKTCIWNEEIDECYIQNSAHKVTINSDGFPQYYLYLFFCAGKAGYFDAIINRVSIGHLTQDKLINIRVLQPPKMEQTKIALHIDLFNTKFNSVSSSKFLEIEKLKEYKATLINSAVTGKIKVN